MNVAFSFLGRAFSSAPRHFRLRTLINRCGFASLICGSEKDPFCPVNWFLAMRTRLWQNHWTWWRAMLNWLFRRKNDLPSYALLEAAPTRRLPEDLLALENSDDFGARRDRIEQDLSDRPLDTEAPGTVTFLKSGNGLLQIRVGDPQEPCLLLFSNPLKAVDYSRVLLPKENFQLFCSSAEQTTKVVQDFRENAGTTQVALDRCPRCNIFTSVGAKALATGTAVATLLRIHKATELGRNDLYFDYAQQAARSGQWLVARNVALELVGHVTMENPRVHLLLGKLGVQMRDRRLLSDAKSFLRFLRADGAVADLENARKMKELQF
jgi:hypothetical protein